MLCFVFWDAYVGILQDALDTDGYFCLSFKQPRASGMCWLAGPQYTAYFAVSDDCPVQALGAIQVLILLTSSTCWDN